MYQLLCESLELLDDLAPGGCGCNAAEKEATKHKIVSRMAQTMGLRSFGTSRNMHGYAVNVAGDRMELNWVKRKEVKVDLKNRFAESTKLRLGENTVQAKAYRKAVEINSSVLFVHSFVICNIIYNYGQDR